MDNKMTGAEIFVKALEEEGVDTLFGYPGGALIPIYDEIFDADFKHILPHHEQGGIHAADGYARSTGRVGVTIATSGPGATNLVTGLATAYMDSVPIVAFTGQVPSHMLGTDAFQEADITGISMPITKHNYLVKDANNLGRIIKEAFHIASTGRPGPVLVDIPKDVMVSKADFDYSKPVDLRGYKPNYDGHPLQIKGAADRINQAEKPVIYAGGGVNISGAAQYLRELAEKAKIPVTTTLTGLGAFDEGSELSLGMPGMHGSTEANLALSNADLIIAVGCRFDDRVTGKLDKFGQEADIIHIDIDPAEVGKRVAIDIPIVGDVKRILKKLNPRVEKKEANGWGDQIREWKVVDNNNNQTVGINGALSPRPVIEALSELTDGQAILATEVGQHQMWTAQFYQFSRPGQFLSSGGLGTMGYGLPAAIGAQVGNPDEPVFLLSGDGSIQMNIQELATIKKNKLPVKIIILNNKYLGMVRQWQDLFKDKRYAATCMSRQVDCPPKCKGPNENCPEMVPDFIKLAESYGIKGEMLTEESEIVPALKRAIAEDGPYLIDCIIEREENVFPMVPPGGSLYEMILEEESE
ncbi:MAG: biosynthetic-type acetolactate synthase large subunit [Halarsenatibacteraceae bacterium]